MDGAGFAENLSSFDFGLLNTTEKCADVIACFSLIKKFLEHFNACNSCALLFIGETNDFNYVANLNCTSLNSTRSNRTTTCDGEYVLDRHKERKIGFSFGSRNVFVNNVHEFKNRLVLGSVDVCGCALKSFSCGATNDGCIVAGEFVLVEKVTNVHFNEFKKFVVVNEIALVEVNYDCGNANLTGKKNVLACLLKGTVGSSDNEDRTVHLSCTCDHVLNVVCVSGAVNVRIVTLLCLVLNVSCVDCNTTSLFLGSVIDLVVSKEFVLAVCKRKHLCDSCRESCLTVVNVSDRTNVYVRFGSFEMSLCHYKILLVLRDFSVPHLFF